MVARLLRPVGEVIRIDPDAVPADEAGRKGRKFHFVRAAASTSPVSRPIFAKIRASSFMRAMFTSRWTFSITFAASATRIEGARCTPARATAP